MTKAALTAILATAALALMGCGNKGGDVLARINDKVMTLGEFNQRIERLPKHYRDIITGQKKKFLDELIKEELLHEEALKLGIGKDEETREVIEEAKRKIIISRLIKNEVDDKVSVSDEEIKSYYDGRSEEFMLPERWRASHILVDTLDEAEEIKERLNQGAAFEELARERSIDTTAKREGDVGYFSKGQLVREFEDTCFALEVGEISDIVKTKFGYHIIKLTERKSPELQEFEKVEGLIKKELSREKRQGLLDKLIKGLEDKAKVTVHEELIDDEPREEE